MIIEIEIDINGKKANKKVNIKKMGAMEGWNLQQRYIEFVSSKDQQFRIDFTMQILKFASIEINGNNSIDIVNSDVIENHIQTWMNIKKIFESILIHNGIDPEKHAEKEHYWTHAGAELAAAFLAETINLMAPIIERSSDKDK